VKGTHEVPKVDQRPQDVFRHEQSMRSSPERARAPQLEHAHTAPALLTATADRRGAPASAASAAERDEESARAFEPG
jgi:hypothetical protein